MLKHLDRDIQLASINFWVNQKIGSLEHMSEQNSEQLLRIVSDYADHIKRREKLMSDIKDSLHYLLVEAEKALLHEVQKVTSSTKPRRRHHYVTLR